MACISLVCMILGIVMSVMCMAHARDCILSRQQIQDEKRVPAYLDNRNHLDNWRWDIASAKQTVRLICNAGDVHLASCRANGQFDLNIPTADCANPIKAVVQQIQDADCAFQSYRVGYEVGNNFMELYRSCYDTNNMILKYTTHKTAYHPTPTDRPKQSFTLDGIINSADADSFSDEHVYNRFVELFGKRQKYVRSTTDTVIDRGHLVPSADFLFNGPMKATFKYINAFPQFSSINRGNWKTIETWVRNEVRPGTEVWIITGVTGVLHLEGKPVYLLPNNRNPIPEWIFKIFNHQDGRRLVFMTYNNPYAKKCSAPRCTVIDCPSNLRLNNEPSFGLTVCCDPNKPINT